MVCRSLTDLSEDLIFGIAFSGYLGFNWQSMRNILLTSKTLYIIGQRQVGLISFNDDLLEDSFLTTMRTLRNVSCINIPYMPYTMTSEVMTYMSTFYRTLHGLNLRGTEVDDVALLKLLQCHPLVQQRQASPVDSSSPPSSSSSLLSPDDIDKLSIGDPFPKLRFLDLSKSHSTQRPLITDLGLRTFQSCTGIRWLSLGMTSITDSTIEWICNSMKSLENLSIPLCHGITDKCCHVLRQTKLVVLDITFCKGLTNAAIAILFENNSPLSNTLEVFSCPYLKNFYHNELQQLLEVKPLRRLDCRDNKLNETISNDWQQIAKQHFEIVLFSPKDQIEGKFRSLYEISNSSLKYEYMWPLYHWPYCQELF